MKGLKDGIRVAVVCSMIALLATAIPFATAGSDDDKKDEVSVMDSKAVDNIEKDRGTQKAAEAGLRDGGIAERRGRLSRLDSTTGTIVLEMSGPEDEAKDSSMGRITLCHKPGRRAERTLFLPEPAIPGHLGHGDYLGVCPGDETESAP